MLETLKRLALGLALIALAAGVLLYTDRGSRKSARNNSRASGGPAKVFRVALVVHASIPALEEMGRDTIPLPPSPLSMKDFDFLENRFEDRNCPRWWRRRRRASRSRK